MSAQVQLKKIDRVHALLGGLIVLLNIIRFAGLEASPPGFFMDESANAAHIICLRHSGADALGVKWPLFSRQFEDARQAHYRAGMVPPTHLYFGAAWTTIFGDSIASIRAISAFWMTLATVGIFLLARSVLDTRAGIYCALAASVSPWGFQLSRFSGMEAFLPAFLVFAVLFARLRKVRYAVLAGLFLALAMYAYPPARAQVPLLAILLVAFHWRELKVKFIAAAAITFIVAIVPLVVHLSSQEARSRVTYVTIFSDEFRAQPSYPRGSFAMPIAFLKNLAAHFSPRYLLISGDENLRHSSQAAGEWSWLDIFAICAMVGAMSVRSQSADSFPENADPSKLHRYRRFVIFSICAYVSGIIPAAVTWEGIPHAVRSAGAWPFLALVVGSLLWWAGMQFKSVPWAVLLIALAFSSYFLWDYFKRYPAASASVWQAPLTEAAIYSRETGSWAQFLQSSRPIPRVSTQYFLMHYAFLSCEESRSTMERFYSTVVPP